MFLSFKDFIARKKKQFRPYRYEEDLHYRAVLFHQYGERYRWYCKKANLQHEYDAIAYDVEQYEKRIQRYHTL